MEKELKDSSVEKEKQQKRLKYIIYFLFITFFYIEKKKLA